MALAQGRSRGRLAGRENLFYLAVLGLAFTITLVWAGIYYLYTLSSADGVPAAVVLPPTATATNVPPTATVDPTVTPTVDTPPSPPTGLTAVASATGVALNWNRSGDSDVAGYDVFRAETVSGQYIKLNSRRLQRLETAFVDDQAPAGKRLRYRVVAVDTSGQASAAATIDVPMLDATATPAPTSTVTPEAPTLTPTPPSAPAPVAPTPTERVVYVPGPPVEVTRVVVPTTAPAAPPTDIPTPTDTAEPTATDTPEPTPWSTPLPAATETPTLPPEPTQAQPLPPTPSEPSPAPSAQASAPGVPAPSAEASSPASEVAPTVELTTEPVLATPGPSASTTP